MTTRLQIAILSVAVALAAPAARAAADKESTPLDSVLRSKSAQKAPPPVSGLQMWKSLGASVAIIGGLFALSVYLKKRFNGQVAVKGKARRIRLVERCGLDTRRSLLLVQVDEREYLLGVGPQDISCLATVKDKPAERAPARQALDFGNTDELGTSNDLL